MATVVTPFETIRSTGSKLSEVMCFPFSLHCRDVQPGDNHAAFVIEPYNNPASLRVDCGVVSTGNAIPISIASDDNKRLKQSSVQKLTDVTYHASQPSRTGPGAQASR